MVSTTCMQACHPCGMRLISTQQSICRDAESCRTILLSNAVSFSCEQSEVGFV